MGTVSSDIVSYNGDHSYYALSNASNGYHDSTNTSYASMNLTRGSRASSYMYWEFQLSQIPADATIDRVTCNYKARTSSGNTSYISAAEIQLCSGTTRKGTAQSILTTSTNAGSISSPGSWTAAEVNAGVKLVTAAQRGTSRTNSNYYIYFYGADIEIEYTEASGEKMYVKANGSWVQVTKAYKKVNGQWVEQSDLTQLFDDGKVIIKG